MGRDESVRQRNAGDVLEELLEALRASQDRQQRALEQLATQQAEWEQSLRQELRSALMREEQELRALRALVDVLAAQLRAVPTGTHGGSTEPESKLWGEIRRIAEEALARSTALDHTLAATLAAIRERLEDLATTGQSTAREMEKLARAVVPEERDVGADAGRAAKQPNPVEMDISHLTRASGAEEESEFRREWKGAWAALHQQLAESREEENRRWRALEHRLQDLEHSLQRELPRPTTGGAIRVALYVLLGSVIGAALVWVAHLWPRGSEPGVPATAPPATVQTATKETAPTSSGTNLNWLQRADDALAAGNPAAAERVLRQALRHAPDDVGLRLRLALLLAEQRRIEAAREQANEALRIDPHSFEARRLLSSLATDLPAPGPGSAGEPAKGAVAPAAPAERPASGKAASTTKPLPGEAKGLEEPSEWIDDFELP